MNDGGKVVFSFPLMVEQSVGSSVCGQLGETLPPIGLPFNGAIGAVEFANAIARMLSLPVSFKLGQIGTFAVAFNGAVHGFEEKRSSRLVNQQYSQKGPGSTPVTIVYKGNSWGLTRKTRLLRTTSRTNDAVTIRSPRRDPLQNRG